MLGGGILKEECNMLFAVDVSAFLLVLAMLVMFVQLVFILADGRIMQRLRKELDRATKATKEHIAKIEHQRDDAWRQRDNFHFQIEQSRDVLSLLASNLSQGMGDELTPIAELCERIKAGVETVCKVESERTQKAIKELEEAKSRLSQAIKERNEAKANFDQAIRDLHQQKEAKRKELEACKYAANQRCKNTLQERDEAIKERDEAIRAAESMQADRLAIDLQNEKKYDALLGELGQVRANYLTLLSDHSEAQRTIGELSYYVREMKRITTLAEECLPPEFGIETPAVIPDDPIVAEAPPSVADDLLNGPCDID
jgi:chromosome segregation ATPase